MNQNVQRQIMLPERVTLQLSGQDVVVILGALGEYGPYKAVLPVIRIIEQQMLSQQVKSEYQGPPPGAPEVPADTAAIDAGPTTNQA